MKVDVIINKKEKSRKLSLHSIEATEIQAGSYSKPGSLKFISFLLLRGKFSYFK